MPPRFPAGASRAIIITAFEMLRFRLIKEGEHLSMQRQNPDGTQTLLTMPNHAHVNGSTLSIICTQVDIG